MRTLLRFFYLFGVPAPDVQYANFAFGADTQVRPYKRRKRSFINRVYPSIRGFAATQGEEEILPAGNTTGQASMKPYPVYSMMCRPSPQRSAM